MVQNLAQWRKAEMSRLRLTHTHVKVEQYSAEAESAIGKNNPKSYRMELSAPPPHTENVRSFSTFLIWMASLSTLCIVLTCVMHCCQIRLLLSVCYQEYSTSIAQG